jgi:hypothetical protein
MYICPMETGQQVKWISNTIGEMVCVGVFLKQIEENMSEVICHYVNDKKCIFKTIIETNKLQEYGN